MPDDWARTLEQRFRTTDQLVVAFGCPRHGRDFFVVHDSSMRTVVESLLSDDRVAPATESPAPSTVN
jgi:hypothetical protein